MKSVSKWNLFLYLLILSFCSFNEVIAATTYPQPYISGFTPSFGAPGVTLKVKGTGFTSLTLVKLGAVSVSQFKVISDSQVQVIVPLNSKAGSYQLELANAGHASFSGSAFKVVASATATYAQPYIGGFTPSSGPVSATIIVSGSGFSGLTSVKIGSFAAASFKVVSDNQLQIVVPTSANVGSYQLALANPKHSAWSGSNFSLTEPSTVKLPPVVITPPPLVAPPPVVVNPPVSNGKFSVRVSGNHFIDASGATIQLRGVNYSGFEFVAIGGWNPSDPSGAQAGQAGGPKWSAIQSWKANIVRIPLNEASWLGYSCTDTSGVVHNPDPGGNYKSAVQTQVDQATAAGLYVIIDLHWTAPGTACPMLQSQMADADHSLAFWTSIANTFKTYPSVMFELYNEPFLNFGFSGNAWSYMMSGTGGSFSGFPATSGSENWQDVKSSWTIASYQDMINAVRATGATNVVIVGTMQYTQDLSGWLANKPTDPLHQMAASWHAYPTYGAALGSATYAQPNFSPNIFAEVQAIQAAGFPVIATETGDHNVAGTVGAPLVSTVTAFADQNNVSVIGWAWDVWGDPDNVLIKDVNGTPTDGYGQVFHDWLIAH